MTKKRVRDEIVHIAATNKAWPWQVIEITEQNGTATSRHIALFQTKEDAQHHVKKREIIRHERATR